MGLPHRTTPPLGMTRVTTTCPQCATIFRVNPEQLAARRGQVRCGRCRHVFNGYETVSIGPLEGAPTASTSKKTESAKRASSLGWWARLSGLTHSASRNFSTTARTPAPSILKGVSPRDEFGFRIPFWKLHLGKLVLIGVSVLFLSLCILNRHAIIQLSPGMRPLFVHLVGPFGLQVPFPGDAESWTVESSDLREDNSNTQLFHFSATLRNRSKTTQAYPSIDLNLTDSDGLSIDHQILTPDQYVPEQLEVNQGLAGNSEVSVRLDLKHAGKRGQGYRIVLFFP